MPLIILLLFSFFFFFLIVLEKNNLTPFKTGSGNSVSNRSSRMCVPTHFRRPTHWLTSQMIWLMLKLKRCWFQHGPWISHHGNRLLGVGEHSLSRLYKRGEICFLWKYSSMIRGWFRKKKTGGWSIAAVTQTGWNLN